MYRKAIKDLGSWKKSKSRKPLVLRGARQVGKTWLLKEFGAKYYDSVAYINLDNNPQMEELFSIDFDIERIVNGLELATDTKIEPEKTLIILDEIQEVPSALTSLKYFYENAPGYHVAVAGSLLGVALHEGTSFPVGKVDFIDLYPMSFAEFLYAIKKDSMAKLVDELPLTDSIPFHAQMLDLLKTYYIVGGMPEVVKNYLEEGNLLQTRTVQQKILDAYDQDFSKHAPINVVPRIREIFDILPAELARENKKFIFNMIRSGARAKDYELALMWLEDAGIVKRISRTNSAHVPLSIYANRDAFKLFLLDVGLLGAKANLSPKTVLNGNELFIEFKGAFSEQFVFQEFHAAGFPTYYYADDNSRGEIDFLLDLENIPLPVEVKSGKSLASPSLNHFVEKFNLAYATKLSTRPYQDNQTVVNLPLYLASRVKGLVI